MKLSTFLHDNFVPHIPKPQSQDEKNLSLAPSEIPQAKEQASSLVQPIVVDDISKEKSNKYPDFDTKSVNSLPTSSINGDNQLHRALKGRHLQLLGIGATIGTGLFVTISKALVYGPLSLFLGFVFWSIPILCITVSVAEYVIYLPITSPFVRLGGRCCDTALEVMTAWNFWFLCCAQIPFEVVGVNSVLHFWRDDFSPAIPLAIQVVLYFIINIFGVSVYGEVEFWLSLGKVILAIGLILFTFIVMVGGNPQHDAFGFRYWNNPGPMNSVFPYADALVTHHGSLARFQGFLQCVIQACYTFAGPEYISLVAAEVGGDVRKTLRSAYLQVFIRLSIFFIGGALCVGILVPYNDKTLLETLGASKPGAGSSPYVIAMQNLNIKVLPHIMNALLVTAAFSAGNSYTYCSSRTLYGFALDGFAPKFLTATTKTGIPIYCVLISLCWAFLSFLQLGDGALEVLSWIINIITSCQLINFFILCVVYLFFYRALKAQGIDRSTLPFVSWFQPYTAIFGGLSAFTMIFVASYQVFVPGNWDIKTFLFSYLFIFIDIAIFIGYKLWRRTKWRDPKEVDLVTGLREVEEHEERYFDELLKQHRLDDEGHVKVAWWKRVLTVLFGSD